MTDNNDGTHSADYTVSGGAGSVTLSVETLNGQYVEYYNTLDLTGATDPERLETGPFEYLWGYGNVSNS